MTTMTATQQLDKADRQLAAVKNDGDVVTKRQLDLQKRRTTRALRVTIAVVALIATVALGIALMVLPRLSSTQSTVKLNASSIDALNKARQEALTAGVPANQLPVTPLPGEEVDVNDIVQASVTTVLARIKNDPQFRGEAGQAGPGCPPDNPACVGLQGEPGIDGQKGDPGVDGINGKPGIDGRDGTNGIPGPIPNCEQNGGTCKGEPGLNAPTPVNQSFVGTQQDCAFQTTYSDGTQLATPTPGANCFPAPAEKDQGS